MNRYVLSFTSQQCNVVKIIPHYCYWFKHHRSMRFLANLAIIIEPLRQVSDASPNTQVKLQPKHATA